MSGHQSCWDTNEGRKKERKERGGRKKKKREKKKKKKRKKKKRKEKKKRRKKMQKKKKTRLDTRPIPVADGWAGAEMRVFPLFDSTDRRTDGPTDGRTKPLIESLVRD